MLSLILMMEVEAEVIPLLFLLNPSPFNLTIIIIMVVYIVIMFLLNPSPFNLTIVIVIVVIVIVIVLVIMVMIISIIIIPPVKIGVAPDDS